MKTKNLLAIALLTAVCLPAFTACGSESKKDQSNDSTETVAPGDTTLRKAVGHAPTTNIRYVDIDSVLANYTYAVQESKKMQQKALELQQYENSLTANLQKKANDFQQKYQSNGFLSQESFDAAQKELQQLQETSQRNLATRAQSLDAEAARVQQNVMNSITNYINDYNKDKKYDAILFKNAGIFFNPELDITKEVIEGLNATANKTEKE